MMTMRRLPRVALVRPCQRGVSEGEAEQAVDVEGDGRADGPGDHLFRGLLGVAGKLVQELA